MEQRPTENSDITLHEPLLSSEAVDRDSSDEGVVWSRASLPLLGGGMMLAFIAAVLGM